MNTNQTAQIALLPGDGIGPEVCDAVRLLTDGLSTVLPEAALSWKVLPAGAAHFQQTGEALPESTLAACAEADAIFLGAMGLPEVRYPDGTEISPQLDIREHFDLYAGVRPIRAVAGIPATLADPRAAAIDFVLIREQTEGLFFNRKGTRIDDKGATDDLYISDEGSRRISRYAFEYARQRQSGALAKHVTLVDKANVLGSMAYFRSRFEQVAADYKDIASDCAYIDAMALNLVRKPWAYDVLVTENQFGDILSDLCAALIGGMGMAPSGDIGDNHAMFQPAHGSAPDIAGQGLANPTAAILSAAMMLDWLGVRRANPAMREAARRIEAAVDSVFADGRLITAEFGGAAGTMDVAHAVLNALRS